MPRTALRTPIPLKAHEFELTIEMLGKRVTRKAKAEYAYTPEWEYYEWRQCRLGVS